MIDPYEALVTLARADAGLTAVVGDRIDVWHRYGQDFADWSQTVQSLLFVASGGELNKDDGYMRPVIECRCYGDTPFECGEVWKALVAFTVEHNERRTVVTSSGKALVADFLPRTGEGMPQLLFDEDVRPRGGMPYYSVFMQATIAMQDVT